MLITRVIRNDPTKSQRQGKPVLLSHILETLGDWRLYGHLIGAFLSMVMISPMNVSHPSRIPNVPGFPF